MDAFSLNSSPMALVDRQRVEGHPLHRPERIGLIAHGGQLFAQRGGSPVLDDDRVTGFVLVQDEATAHRVILPLAELVTTGVQLVVSYPRRGTFATGMDIADLAHISEIRAQLEPLAAERARTSPLYARLKPQRYLDVDGASPRRHLVKLCTRCLRGNVLPWPLR